jgi:peptidoglycan/xylan/chitin deacetylase (PgdA/CDA1 family)
VLRGKTSGLRNVVRSLWIYFLYISGVIRWARKRIAANGGIIVLTFHRVLEDADLEFSNSPAGMTVRSATFHDALRFLAANYQVYAIDGLPPSWESTSEPRFAITFDDGWQDTASVAFPLAQKNALPLTVFVCPGLIGKPSPFWPEQVIAAWRVSGKSQELSAKFAEFCKSAALGEARFPISSDERCLDDLLLKLKEFNAGEREQLVCALVALSQTSLQPASARIDATMSWEDVGHLLSHGVQIGSHTQHHQILTKISSPEVQCELSDSNEAIERALGRKCPVFAYPNGSWSPAVRKLVIETGHSQAFINTPGIWTSATDRWLIPRANIWEGSLTGLSRRFSRAVFEYVTIWKSYRGQRKQDLATHDRLS